MTTTTTTSLPKGIALVETWDGRWFVTFIPESQKPHWAILLDHAVIIPLHVISMTTIRSRAVLAVRQRLKRITPGKKQQLSRPNGGCWQLRPRSIPNATSGTWRRLPAWQEMRGCSSLLRLRSMRSFLQRATASTR